MGSGDIKIDPCSSVNKAIDGATLPLKEGLKLTKPFFDEIAGNLNVFFPDVAKIFNDIISEMENGVNKSIHEIKNYIGEVREFISLVVYGLSGSYFSFIVLTIFPYVYSFWNFLMDIKVINNISLRTIVRVSMLIVIIMMIGSFYMAYIGFKGFVVLIMSLFAKIMSMFKGIGT